MRTLILLAAVVWFSSTALAQYEYEVCGQEEFCICWDGSASTVDYTFVPCAPLSGQALAMVFCSGDVPPDVDTYLYDGEDSTAPLIYDMPANTTELPDVNMVSAAGAFHLEIVHGMLSSQSCATGDLAPWRFLVIAGATFPLPGPGACTGSGPSCLTTHIGNVLEPTVPRIFYANGELLATAPLPSAGTLEVLDLSGRLLQAHHLNGGTSVRLRASLASGTYLVALRTKGERIVQRVLVAD